MNVMCDMESVLRGVLRVRCVCCVYVLRVLRVSCVIAYATYVLRGVLRGMLRGVLRGVLRVSCV